MLKYDFKSVTIKTHSINNVRYPGDIACIYTQSVFCHDNIEFMGSFCLVWFACFFFMEKSRKFSHDLLLFIIKQLYYLIGVMFSQSFGHHKTCFIYI